MSSTHRILTNFTVRKLEWCIAFYTIIMGAWIAAPWDAMATFSFRLTLRLMPEFAWGILYLTVGIFHTAALHINGRTAWTPFVRVLALFLNSQVFLAMSLSFIPTNPGGTGIINYLLFSLLFCGVALASAAEDCGREWKIWRSGRNERD